VGEKGIGEEAMEIHVVELRGWDYICSSQKVTRGACHVM